MIAVAIIGGAIALFGAFMFLRPTALNTWNERQTTKMGRAAGLLQPGEEVSKGSTVPTKIGGAIGFIGGVAVLVVGLTNL